MKIGLVSSFVPFVNGGARFIVEWLEEKLREAGHQVERYYLPFIDDPEDLLTQTAAWRMLDLSRCERVICFRPPAHVVDHPDKVLWFIHHIRAFYDLWDSPYSPPHSQKNLAVRKALHDLDTNALNEAKAVFTNSQVVADRLMTFNGVKGTPLYPPIYDPSRFRNDGYGDEIVAVCRIEPHKRQTLMIEAMKHVKSGVRLRLCGTASSPAYGAEITAMIQTAGLSEKVVFDDRWITEQEKADVVAPALAVAYLPKDEDSYGYPSLEGAHAKKAVLTTTDSGGVLELAQDGCNGFVTEPDPQALAEAMDKLWLDKALAKKMGEAAHARIDELKIDWGTVVERLTA